jgi:group I intron endonuclease
MEVIMSNSIYRITNKVNGKFYIGKTTKPVEQRFKTHIYNSKKQNTYLYRAMRKYGSNQFIVEQLEIINNKQDLDIREKYWIEKLSPHYNMTAGGEGGNTSSSPNYIEGMKNRVHPHTPTYGMLGKKHPLKGKRLTGNFCPVVCEGIEYPSVGDAQIAYPGCNIRKRLDNPRYPNFYRLRERTKRK